MARDLSKRLYFRDAEEWKRTLPKKFSDESLQGKIVNNGIVLPARNTKDGWKGGVCDKNFNFVAGFSRHDLYNNWKATSNFATVNASYTVNRDEIVKLDEAVIFGGSLIGHFGHFMMECWSRLWFVIKNPQLQLKILFITTTHGGYHSWFDDFFKLMGIAKERIVYVKKPTQCNFVIVPSQAQYSPVSFTKEFLIPYQAIKSRVKPDTRRKLYLTRAEFEAEDNIGVHCYNEKYFEDFFIARGFESVKMEKLSVEKQISLIMGADEIAATIGTLTHWIMFCKPTAKFIMLSRTKDFPIGLQILANEAAQIDYYIVDASKNFLYANRNVGVVMLGANKYWKAFVADYFGEQIDEDDDNSYFDDALDKYLKFWCKKYAGSNNRLIESLKDMCNRIIALETELSKNRPLLNYQTHVGKKGWGEYKSENQLSNPFDPECDIQAIKISFSNPFHDIYYAVYDKKDGWSQEVSTGQMAGTTGQKKSITGIKIRLDEVGAKNFDILYRVHKFDGKWTSWAKNGEELLSAGVKLNSIQIKLQPKNHFKNF